MIKTATLIAGGIASLFLGATPASAQDAAPLYACSTQAELQQTIDSAGDYVPEGCRSLKVSVLNSQGQRLCVLQLGESQGVLQQIQDFVSENELWVRCDLLDGDVSPAP